MSAQIPATRDVEPPPPPSASTPRRLPRRAPGRILGPVGAVLLALSVIAAVFAPLLSRHDPNVPSGLPFQPPTRLHPLGTNDVGQDLLAQLLSGARISLTIALLCALVAVAIGLTVALLAGYHRGAVETVLMRIVDLTLAFPFLVLVIVLAAFFGRGVGTTVLVIASVIWARPARVLRSQVLKASQYAHVVAARAMGASSLRVIGRHVLPRVAPMATAQFVRAANIAVMLEASLAFLGLGDPTRVSWGTILHFANARNAFLTDAWAWWVLPPGLALTVVIVGFAFVGYAIEEWADPRLAYPAPRAARKGTVPPGPDDPAAVADVLEVRDLHVHYELPGEAVRAVDGIDLTVGRGRIVGLVGESGSGKSTVATALLGLHRPPARIVSGEMTLAGRRLGKPRRSQLAALRGREIALIPQSAMNGLNPTRTVHQQVAEAAALTRSAADAARRAAELLELVGIPAARHRAYPHEFSGGMRQRVVIAMAMANDPALLVADEPATGLDVITQAKVLQLLVSLRDRFGTAVLLITHDLPLVTHAADDLLVMYGGRIVEAGPTAEVTAAPKHPYTRRLLSAFPSLHGPRRPLGTSVAPAAAPDAASAAAPVDASAAAPVDERARESVPEA